MDEFIGRALTMVDGDQVKVVGWYDNEWGYSGGGRRCPRTDGLASGHACGDLVGCELHGRPDLCRQCPELDDLRNCGRARDRDAKLLCLHGMVERGPAAGLCHRRMGVFRLGRNGRTAKREVEQMARIGLRLSCHSRLSQAPAARLTMPLDQRTISDHHLSGSVINLM